MTEKSSRYQPPPGSEFFLSTDSSGERSGFCIFAPDGDRFSIVGPDGTGKSAEVFNRRPVSEAKCWAAVAAEEAEKKSGSPPP